MWPSNRSIRMVSLIPLVLLLACDGPAAPARQAAPAAPAEKVTIPGASVTFETVALPGEPGKLGPFKIGTKEVTWTEFNAYFESKDLATGTDAVSRPTRAISYFGQVGVPAHFLDLKRPVTN